MNGYDFDKTIYKTDSSTDFFRYMILSRPYLWIFAPWFLLVLALYGLKFMGKKKVKECLFFFVPWYGMRIEKIVDRFWSRHANGIKDWYANQRCDDDVIVSASLGFIIKPMMDTLNIKKWVATNYNIRTGRIEGENCYGEEKVIALNKITESKNLDAFYSDSMSDLPLMKKAKKAYLVDGDNVKEIDVSNL